MTSNGSDEGQHPREHFIVPVQANTRAPRKLITWTDEKNAHLLILIDHVCKEHGIKLPWSEIAALLNEGTSAGAIEQHISKLRAKRLELGLATHPATRSRRKPPPAASFKAVQKPAQVVKPRARRARRNLAPVFNDGIDPDAESDPDAEFGAPKTKRTGQKGGRGRRIRPKTPPTDDSSIEDVCAELESDGSQGTVDQQYDQQNGTPHQGQQQNGIPHQGRQLSTIEPSAPTIVPQGVQSHQQKPIHQGDTGHSVFSMPTGFGHEAAPPALMTGFHSNMSSNMSWHGSHMAMPQFAFGPMPQSHDPHMLQAAVSTGYAAWNDDVKSPASQSPSTQPLSAGSSFSHSEEPTMRAMPNVQEDDLGAHIDYNHAYPSESGGMMVEGDFGYGGQGMTFGY